MALTAAEAGLCGDLAWCHASTRLMLKVSADYGEAGDALAEPGQVCSGSSLPVCTSRARQRPRTHGGSLATQDAAQPDADADWR